MDRTVHITDVQAFYLRLPAVAQDRTDSSQDALVVRVDTDAGVHGIGEADSFPQGVKAVIEAPSSHTIARGLRELLVGRDPSDPEALWDLMYAATLYYGRDGLAIHAMAAVDLALWDIAGKLAGVPVGALLAGKLAPAATLAARIPAYASHMLSVDPAVNARRAADAVASGMRTVKFGWEPFGSDAAVDEAIVAGLREAVGPDVDLCIDAGAAWDVAVARERFERLAPYRLRWVEEPLHPDDLAGYRALSGGDHAPIAAGEEESTVIGFERLLDTGGIDVLQLDPSRVGLTQAMRVAELAAARGVPVATHNFTTDINLAAAAQFLSAIPGTLLIECCMEPSPLRTQIVREPITIDDGDVVVPGTPGLGVDLDPDGLARFLI